MSSRYDSRTTTFSPEGRLYQVEYAVEAIGQAGTSIGIVTTEGIVLATEKRAGHALLESENLEAKHISGEKVFKLAGHMGCAVAGITSDANILVNYCRVSAHRHEYQYQTPMPIEDMCRMVCDTKQGYTQYGGVRPFGVAFLFAGYDKYFGYQLYHTDPSGNYASWKAFAIGEGDNAAQSLLKQHWTDTLTLQQGKVLATKILQRTMDSSNLSPDRIEIATLAKTSAKKAAAAAGDNDDDNAADAKAALKTARINTIIEPHPSELSRAANRTQFLIVAETELKALLAAAEQERQQEDDEKERKQAENERKL